MRSLRLLLVLPLVALAACGSQGIDVAGGDPQIAKGARIFDQRCAGCHTISSAGAQGSSANVNDTEYKDGPNFNQRKEDYEDVLYAIRNGGFSSGPMPQNIVVGEEAEAVARYLERYSGRDR